ncbi:MAG: hypothetical protein D9V47_12055 [Clostridia bacterium]|nr:MAG: hypothetical protein D9V47_12055 [Clostridia bacterium]
MLDWGYERGWSRHQRFGLRQEWLDLYLSDRRGWRHRSILGNRQIDSLAAWLKTAGIEDGSAHLTPLGEQFAARGTACRPLWELLWVNVVFAFPTACWYAHLGPGAWTTTELKALLRQAVPRLAEWTAANAIMELAGLLERTPIGNELGQGQVSGERPRRLVRRGGQPGDAALIHALGRLYLQQGRTRLPWAADFTWPWVVFGCSRQFVLERLTVLDQDYFELDEHGVTICLADKGWWQCGATVISWL